MGVDVIEVPAHRDWLEELGCEPEPVPGSPQAHRVRWPGVAGETLTLTLDPPGRSVAVRWERGGEVLADLVREGAARVTLRSDPTGSEVVVLFETPGLRGELSIRLLPAIGLRDRTLLV